MSPKSDNVTQGATKELNGANFHPAHLNSCLADAIHNFKWVKSSMSQPAVMYAYVITQNLKLCIILNVIFYDGPIMSQHAWHHSSVEGSRC